MKAGEELMGFVLTYPKHTYIGVGALLDASTKIKTLGKKAMVISGRHVSQTTSFLALSMLLKSQGIESVLFTGITGEPTVTMIEEAAGVYKEYHCDFLIGIGGGSVLDSVKAVAVMNRYGTDLSEFMGKEIRGPFPPMVLIPTTAGTGSEATKFTIITDAKKMIKMLLKGDDLIPDVAIVDPDFTKTSPPDITASTGMDALTHAIEAYTSKKGNPYTDLYAVSAIKRIFSNLPLAYEEGDNLEARTQMALAAYEAGICINNASVTLVHGMSRPIGALFHVPHGLSNAMLLHDCLSFAVDGCPERFATLARAIGVAIDTMEDKKAAIFFLEEIKKLCKRCGVPTLAKVGIKKEEFEEKIEKMASDALASGSPGNTIREVTKEDVITIYRGLW